MSGRNNQRPDSRASTTSATTQQDEALLQSMSHDLKPGQMPFTTPGPESALLQYQANMAPQSHMMQFSQAAAQDMGPRMMHAHGLPHNATHHMQLQPQMYDATFLQHDLGRQELSQSNIDFVHMNVGPAPIPTVIDLQDEKRRKGSAVTATNDKELREMLAKNEGRPLRDVAQEVIQKERTPMAEKTKQLFAMLWLRAVCKPAKTSVPRNRVYSQYATRCGTERVVPLNPASFGKLVRVIFPGIQTRRLGVRGESKYHYVDLALEDESNSSLSSSWALHQQAEARQNGASTNNTLDFNNIPRLQADTTTFPNADAGFDSPLFPPTPRGPPSQSQAFVYPLSRGMQPGTAESLTYSRTLRFPSSSMPPLSESDPVDLPPIQPYLPPRTDADTAEALAALYRTHCTSLIDSIRFCKEKQFFRLYMSFHGTLTVPVQKLFTHPNIAPWIEQCDLVMYRTMVRFVSRLTLQAAPVRVINTLSNISGSLHDHIAKTFATHPPHVIEAKVKPATVFASLLYRLIRVNQSAHAAANLLTIDQNREQMWHEWATMVSPKRVMEAELPDCGYEEVHKILTTEMRSLLEPLQAPGLTDDASLYSFDPETSFGAFLGAQGGQSRPMGQQVTTENVLDRWSNFLMSLPARFPNAPARTVLHCISAVGTAALRDITIMSGLSYGHWWVLKIFVDEMALWMAEMGGFLEPNGSANAPSNGNNAFHSPVLDNGNARSSHSGSRMSSMGPTGGANLDQNSRNLFMSESSSQQQQHQPQQRSQSQHRHSQSLNFSAPAHHAQQSSQSFAPPQPHQHSPSFTQQQVADFVAQHQPQQQHQSQHQSQQQQQQQQQFQNLSFAQSNLKHVQPETDIDDSGIGMSLMDDGDELDLSKFGGGSLPAHVMADLAAANGLRV